MPETQIRLTGDRAKSGINPLNGLDLDPDFTTERTEELRKMMSLPVESATFDRNTTDKKILNALNHYIWIDSIFLSKDGSTIVLMGDDMEVTFTS